MVGCLSSEQIELLLIGHADADAADSMELHLKGCSQCQQTLAEITHVHDARHWQLAAQDSSAVSAEDRIILDRLKSAMSSGEDPEIGRTGKAADASDLIGMASDQAAQLGPVVRRNAFPVSFPQVPGFEILCELGRGGMGVVYKARQISQDRIVALKMIQAGLQASEEDLGRFADEADAIARLRHPHIVQILEVGQFDGRLFFVLEFVEGGTLHEQIRNQPQHPRSSAQLLESLARAMHFAHQRDIIHRDLKPANVLLHGRRAFVDIPTEAGQRPTDWDFRRFMPKITDFGLAKLLDKTHGHTASGDVVGTPSYMAPEQAQGKPYPIRPTTDIYSLGAILYEMLTGKPPFLGPTPMDTLFQVHTQEPVPPRKIVREIPPSLETICLKCLRKDPAHRYQTAEELAEDLRLSLDGLPIQARGTNPIRSGWNAIRRRTGSLAFALLALLIAVVASARMVYLWRVGEVRLLQSEAQAVETQTARREIISSKIQHAIDDCEQGYVGRGVLALAETLGDVEPFRQVSDQQNVIHQELAYWYRFTPRLVQVLPDPMAAANFSSDGQYVIAANQSKTVARWELPSGRVDGEPWMVPDRIQTLLSSIDGQRVVAYADGRVHWREWPALTQARSLTGESGEPLESPLALSAKGKLLFGLRNGKPHLLETVAGQIQIIPMNLDLDPATAIWSPNSDTLLLGSASGKVTIVGRTAQGWKESITFKLRTSVLAAAWTDRGRIALVATADGMISFWTLNGEFIRALQAHPAGPISLAANEKYIMTGGVDRVVKIWQSDTGAQVQAIPQFNRIRNVGISHLNSFVSVDEMGGVRIWEMPAGLVKQAIEFGGERLLQRILSSDGKSVYVIAGEDAPRIGHTAVGEQGCEWVSFRELSQFENVRPLAVRADGVAVIAASTAHGNETWLVSVNATQAKTIRRLMHPGTTQMAIFRPDGPEVLTWNDGKANLWNSDSGKQIGKPMTCPSVPKCFAIRRDGIAVAIGGESKSRSGWAQVYPITESSESLASAIQHAHPVVDIAFDSQGKCIHARDSEQTNHLWDCESGHMTTIRPVPEHSEVVAVFPNSDQHLIRNEIGQLQLYLGGDRAFVQLPVASGIQWRNARFSDDGRILVTCWSDGVRLWDARTGVALGRVFDFANVDDASLAGGMLLAWHSSKLATWQLPSNVREKSSRWKQIVSLRTGLLSAPDGSLRLMDGKAWAEVRAEMETRTSFTK